MTTAQTLGRLQPVSRRFTLPTAPTPAPAPQPDLQPPLPVPDFEAAVREIARLQAERDALAAEVDALRPAAALAHDLQLVLFEAPSTWTPRDRIVAAGAICAATDTGSGSEWLAVSRTAETLAADVAMSASTARKSLQRLDAAGFLDYEVSRTAVNRYGEPIPSKNFSTARGDRFQTVTSLAVRRELPAELPDLGDTGTERAARRRATAKRDELTRLRERLAHVECPECGEVGSIAIVCRACGAHIEPATAGEIAAGDGSNPGAANFAGQGIGTEEGIDAGSAVGEWHESRTDTPGAANFAGAEIVAGSSFSASLDALALERRTLPVNTDERRTLPVQDEWDGEL